jgi:hypothetical protein
LVLGENLMDVDEGGLGCLADGCDSTPLDLRLMDEGPGADGGLSDTRRELGEEDDFEYERGGMGGG